MTRRQRLLLLSPAFHGYHRSIAAGFRQLGFEVGVHSYDQLSTVTRKLAHKVLRELPAKVGVDRAGEDARMTAEVAAVIQDYRPDVTLVIRGDQLGQQMFDALDAVGSRKIVWLWDEVRRTSHGTELLDRYDHIISYSPRDTEAFIAAGRPCLHVPNAFDPEMSPAPRHGNEIVFIGARYPRREQLLTHLSMAQVPVRAYGRDWSTHPVDLARTWQTRRPNVPASRDIGRMDGYALTAGAPAAINIHGDQDGFTMKTFEVPGVGGVQLIDREDVSQFYEPGVEVAVFRDDDELLDLCLRAIRDDRWGDALREAGRARTLAEHTWAHRAATVVQLWA